MGVKFSDLPSAVVLNGPDLVPIVQGGVSKKAEASLFLTAATGIGQGGGTLGFDGAGALAGVSPAGQSVTFASGSGGSLNLSVAGQALLGAAAGQLLQLNSNGGSLTIGAAGLVVILSAGGASSVVSYLPIAPGNWAFNPTDLAAAVDRIAAAVAGLLAGPIP